ncbi:hypothetical protein SPRG_09433 [Saprolegnia parasitica CBS 223.65]|uniref:CRAL-TRIO domain-containing protein n=1 Tax=Saprolegnia parasitica (strain CBS 223.65) TaxID=695850 RepID=A0A067C8J5_SAPPC|nr:hypothetical protein SPRG_09433 [Saprolegnia parasitica CBS 223.65]KDO25490.1 hypothetical protein SPRG_09433 [Saprolegnia parasitica CBS 223.65]|eukprot:XP_012203915.1 hypothetical protein SPRG_09433 [Saprolegnia parasitica CBS 223.65]
MHEKTGTIARLREQLLLETPEARLVALGFCQLGRLDDTIEKYAIARDWDADATLSAMRSSIAWRVEQDVPSLMAGPALPNEKLEAIRRFNPQGFHGEDKDGRLVYIERTGYLDCDALLKVVTPDDILKAHVQKCEYKLNVLLPRQVVARGAAASKIVLIYDLANVGFSTFKTDVFTAIQRITNINQEHYPETLHKVYIVNAPFFFYGTYKLIEVFLSDRIRHKIAFVGRKDELLADIPATSLPTFLGGSCNCFPGQPHGGCVSSTAFTQTRYFSALDAHFED